MGRKRMPEWKGEILLSTQHGPGRSQEMVDHTTVAADDVKQLYDLAAQNMRDMANGLFPDGTSEVRSGYPLTAIHFSMLITRKAN